MQLVGRSSAAADSRRVPDEKVFRNLWNASLNINCWQPLILPLIPACSLYPFINNFFPCEIE